MQQASWAAPASWVTTSIAVYATPSSCPCITKSHHLSLFRNRFIHSSFSRSVSLRYIFIMSSHLRLGFRSVTFPSVFPHLQAYIFFHMHATCLAHSFTLIFGTRKKWMVSFKLQRLYSEDQTPLATGRKEVLLREQVWFSKEMCVIWQRHMFWKLKTVVGSWWMSTEHWWNNNSGGIVVLEKILSSLCTTNLTWTGLGSSPDLRGGRLATKCMRFTWIVFKHSGRTAQ